ncbi:unnamed protein product [Rhizophagus irregularis]|nr:unnamed protein product [Rhizophagus irregularis]
MGRERPDWRSTFKHEWKLLAKRQLSMEQYITDTHNWVCGCQYFLTNHFFLCKHLLVKQKGEESTESFGEMFEKVDSWENNITDKVACLNLFKILRLVSSKFYYRFIIVSAEFRQATLITEHEECEDLYNKLITTTENTLQILREQKAVGNLKWGKSVEKNFHSIIKMQEEIKTY